MITLTKRAMDRFLRDPVGSLQDMRAAPATLPVGASLLVALTLVTVIVDWLWGAAAFPASTEAGGKRVYGPLVIAALDVARIASTAAVIWIGSEAAMKAPVPLGLAVWMTVPYAGALLVAELLQAGAYLLVLATGLDLYGVLFMVGFGGSILILVLSVRVLHPDKDWLGCLPLGFGAFSLGYFLPPLVLIVAAGYLLFGTHKR